MSMRIVPATTPVSNDAHMVSAAATAHPLTGTHDAFRYGLKSAAQAVAGSSASPLQARLQKWQETQQNLQASLARQNFGLSVPLRQAMELKLVSENPHNPLLSTATPGALPLGGSHNIAHEILSGTDEALDAQDFMSGGGILSDVLDVNTAMERSRGM